MSYTRKQVGKKYDWISVFRFLWHTPAEKNNRWFCSELAEKALETASNKLLRGNCSEHSPRDTAMSTLLEENPTVAGAIVQGMSTKPSVKKPPAEAGGLI